MILVHGHWYYYRVALLAQYFFYKNVACFTVQLVFSFFSNFSFSSLYDDTNLTLYNILYTALPILVFSLLAQNLPAATLLYNPALYRRIANNKLLAKVGTNRVSSFELFVQYDCYKNKNLANVSFK